MVCEGPFISYNHNITWFQVWFGDFPLSSLLKMLKVLSGPSFPKWWIIDWQSVNGLQSDGSSVVTVSGYACRGRPTRKCPGVRTSIPSWLWLVVAHRGLELRQASICVRMVENSSKSSL